MPIKYQSILAYQCTKVYAWPGVRPRLFQSILGSLRVPKQVGLFVLLACTISFHSFSVDYGSLLIGLSSEGAYVTALKTSLGVPLLILA